MQQLGYGRFESLRIRHGELVLDPGPTFVRSVKSGDATPNRPDNKSHEFELKHQTAQLEFVRSVDAGEIRVLEVRGVCRSQWKSRTTEFSKFSRIENLWRLVLPRKIEGWSLTSLHQRSVKTWRQAVECQAGRLAEEINGAR